MYFSVISCMLKLPDVVGKPIVNLAKMSHEYHRVNKLTIICDHTDIYLKASSVSTRIC